MTDREKYIQETFERCKIEQQLKNESNIRFCEQCNKEISALDYMIGPVCLSCCKKNHKKVTG